MKAALSILCVAALLRSALSVSLRLSPDQSQFFSGDSVSLSCEDSSGDWTVRRNTSRENRTQCDVDWGRLKDKRCNMTMLPPYDVGWYWCESTEGQTSASVHITVKEKPKTNGTAPCTPRSSSTPPPPSSPSSSPAPPAPLPPLLWPVVCCVLGVLLGLGLVLLVLAVKRCRRRKEERREQNGRSEEITYSEIRLSHDRRRPIRRSRESEQSPVYSTVKTQEDLCYSAVTINSHQTRGPGPGPGPEVVYSAVRKGHKEARKPGTGLTQV